MATALAYAQPTPARRKAPPRPTLVPAEPRIEARGQSGAKPRAEPRLQAELDQLSLRHGKALEALAQAGCRAERAERRLRSRLVARVWPTTLCGLTGGFMAIVALRLAGF